MAKAEGVRWEDGCVVGNMIGVVGSEEKERSSALRWLRGAHLKKGSWDCPK